MHKILLVDDDPIILLQLRRMIHWESLSCELAAEAANGKEAIELIERYHPDIVITDISMPGIDGMELIDYIDRYGDRMQVIAISAFDNFDYVRRSLKGGASDYLLKHQLTEDVLENAISTAIAALKVEGESAGYSIQEKREHLIYLLLHDRHSQRQEELKELHMEWLKGSLVLILGRMDTENVAVNEEAVRILMDETIKYYRDYLVIQLERWNYLLLLSAENKESQEISEIVEQVQRNVKRFCSADMSFVVSRIMEQCENIAEVIRKAKEIQKEHDFHGEKAFIAFMEEQAGTGIFRWSIGSEERLMRCLQAGEDMEGIFDEIFTQMEEKAYSKSQMQVFYVEIMTLLIRKMEEYDLEGERIFGEENPYEEYFRIGTFQELKAYLTGKFRLLQEEIRRAGKIASYSGIVQDSIAYIEAHYREKISLSVIAEKLAVSPSYLSRTFKKGTGMTLVNYINQVRMEKAKELMNQGRLSLNEVACEVGIYNYNYFYMLFREIYGIAPSDYTKNMGGQEENRQNS